MDMTFSNKLNTVIKKSCGTSDVSMDMFGLPTAGRYDMAVISPMWKPTDVFKESQVEILFQRETNNVRSYLLRHDEKRIIWLHIDPSAGNMMDACLGLANIDCNRIIFLGLCSTMKEDLTAGDLVVPNKAISGTGATRYLLDDMSGDPTFLKERRTPPKGILWLSKAAIKAEAKLNTRTVFSTDTILGALLHQEDIKETGADVVDMEAAAFGRCMIVLERPGVALLVVASKLGFDRLGTLTDEEQDRLNNTVENTLSKLLLNLI